MGLYLPQRWKRQPQGPVRVDRSNPLGAQTRIALLGSTGTPVDIVSGSSATAGNYETPSTGQGRTFRFGTTNLYLPLTKLDDVDVQADKTFVLVSTVPGASNQDFSIGYRDANFGWGIGFGNYDATTRTVAQRNPWAGVSPGFLLTTNSTKPWVLVFVWKRLTSTTNSCDIYGNGTLLYSGTNNNDGAGGTFGTGPFRLFTSHTGNNLGSEPAIAMFAALAGAAGAAQVAEITANPWQLFAPQRATFFSLPGTSGPVLSLPTVIDITSTSVRPRVTITY